MKSFVRDRHDEILLGFVAAGVITLMIGVVLFGEVAYLAFYIVAAVLFAAQKLRQRRQGGTRARSGATRSTGSR
ncbi:MAG: hypothetical protein ACOYD4_09300 [Solirubrobacterales bacterium]